MQTRNLIKSGPSSYVVSIPLGWVRRNGLAKGDFLYMEEKGNSITYSCRKTLDEKIKTITINIDKKTDKQIERYLKSAYVKSYNTFVFEGEDLKTKSKYIKELVKQLVAVEIMEQSPKKIIAQEMLDKEKNSPDKIITRMDMIVRQMIRDIEESLAEKMISEYIKETDDELNRLHMLGQRIVIGGMETPSTEPDHNFRLLMHFRMMNLLELIADTLKDISTISNKVKKEVFSKMLASLKQEYLRVMKAFYREDTKEALAISVDAENTLNEFEHLMEKIEDTSSARFAWGIIEIIKIIGEMSLIVLNKNT